MGKNLKKVIFSVLLLAAVIVVSPKDAKAAGKVWMAGFNDNSITIQWTPQSLNGYRVDGYYLEKIGTQEIILRKLKLRKSFGRVLQIQRR